MSAPAGRGSGFFRGMRTFFIAIGIVLAFLVVVGLAVVYATYQEAKPYIETEYPTEVYSHTESCTTPCTSLALEETFGPAAGARQLRASLSGSVFAFGGSIHVSVKDPSGKLVFDKTYTGSTSAQSIDDDASWTPAEGTWTVTVQKTGFQGSLDVTILSVGLPPGTL